MTDPTLFDVVDRDRMARLLTRVRTVMEDGRWYTLAELAQRTGGSEAGVSARIRELANRYGIPHEKRRVQPGKGLFEYRLVERRTGSDGYGALTRHGDERDNELKRII